eukprot:6055912-Prorocentrum_lima.AAC.1
MEAEALRWLGNSSLEELRSLFSTWYEGGIIPDEVIQARVVLLFKKGDANVLDNYRPMSLLTVVYK